MEPYELSVEGKDDVARLMGTVDTFFEWEQTDVIARAKGVSAIENHLLASADRNPLFYDPCVDEFCAFDIEYDLDADRE
jgi:hypothetical protein